MLGLLIVMGFAIYWVLKPKEEFYTIEATVEMFRNDASEGERATRQVVGNQSNVSEESSGGSASKTTDESSGASGQFFFINQCSDPLGVRMAEWQVFQPDERGYLKVPTNQGYVTFTMVRIRNGEGERVLEKKIFTSARQPRMILTAREDEAGKVKLESEVIFKSGSEGGDG